VVGEEDHTVTLSARISSLHAIIWQQL